MMITAILPDSRCQCLMFHVLEIHSTNHSSIQLSPCAKATPGAKHALHFHLLPVNTLLKG